MENTCVHKYNEHNNKMKFSIIMEKKYWIVTHYLWTERETDEEYRKMTYMSQGTEDMINSVARG